MTAQQKIRHRIRSRIHHAAKRAAFHAAGLTSTGTVFRIRQSTFTGMSRRQRHRLYMRMVRALNSERGLTQAGTPRIYKRISEKEHAWREFRDTMAIPTEQAA